MTRISRRHRSRTMHGPLGVRRERAHGALGVPAVIALAVVALATLLAPVAAWARESEAEFLDALWLETIEGDFGAAAAAYDQIFTLDGLPTEIAARAHLRLGICKRLDANPADAVAHFRAAAENYPREQAIAQIARRYLGGRSLEDPARFLPPDTILFAELLDPSAIIALLEQSLRGTPLEDPVHAEPRIASRPDEPRDLLPEPVRIAAALLNRAFLRELEKVERIAFGIAPDRSGELHGIGIIAPGRSDVLRGIFHGSLSVFPRERIEGYWVYSPNPRELHVAVGDDAVVWSDSHASLIEALARQRSGSPSLATRESWHAPEGSARAGAVRVLVEDGWAEALVENADEEDRAWLAIFVEALGLADIHPLRVEISTAPGSDRLDLVLEARNVAEGDAPIWPWLRTRSRDPGLEMLLPDRTVAWAAARLDREAERITGLRQALEELGTRHELLFPLIDGLRSAEASFHESDLRRLLEGVDEAVVALCDADDFPSVASLVFVVSFAPEVDGDRLLRETLPRMLRSIVPIAPSSPDLDERPIELRAGVGTLVTYEPLPGHRSGWARFEKGWIISLDWDVLEPLLLSSTSGAPAAPSPANKSAWLAPARFLEAARKRTLADSPWSRIIARSSGIFLATRELPGRFELTVGATEASAFLRALWNEWARRKAEEAQVEKDQAAENRSPGVTDGGDDGRAPSAAPTGETDDDR